VLGIGRRREGVSFFLPEKSLRIEGEAGDSTSLSFWPLATKRTAGKCRRELTPCKAYMYSTFHKNLVSASIQGARGIDARFWMKIEMAITRNIGIAA
jgi:hypothetical protein